MKRAVVGLMMLGLIGVANASTFTNSGLWNVAANWDAGIPDGNTDANIWGARDNTSEHAVITNYTASARDVSLKTGLNAAGSGGNLTVEADGVLNARSVNVSKSGRVTNRGMMDLSSSVILGSTKGEVYNYGTIDTDANLSMNKTVTFNMLGGTFNGVSLNSGTTAGQKVNLYGGTMTFNDVTCFDAANLTMTVRSPGMLIIEGQDKRTYLQTAIDAGKITCDEDLGLFYVDGNTILKVPAGTVISIQ